MAPETERVHFQNCNKKCKRGSTGSHDFCIGCFNAFGYMLIDFWIPRPGQQLGDQESDFESGSGSDRSACSEAPTGTGRCRAAIDAWTYLVRK